MATRTRSAENSSRYPPSEARFRLERLDVGFGTRLSGARDDGISDEAAHRLGCHREHVRRRTPIDRWPPPVLPQEARLTRRGHAIPEPRVDEPAFVWHLAREGR